MEPRDLIDGLQRATGRVFSPDQKAGVLSGDGPIWITAGPGSGKSEVLVARALKLLACDGVPAGSIILTTFTEKAAANLSDRIASRLIDLGLDSKIDVTELRVGTLHSLCDDIMRDHRYPDYIDLELLDEDSRLFFLYRLDRVIEYFTKHWEEFEPVFPSWGINPARGPNRWFATNAAAFLFDRITEFQVDVESMKGSKKLGDLAKLYSFYCDRLRENSRCDFSILQRFFMQFLGSAHGREFLKGDPGREILPLRHLLVDEFQDTNPIQEEIYFRMAADKPHNIAVVGDDDQALYRFRGGTVDSLVNFGARCRKQWGVDPVTVNLNENFRSHPKIVDWFNDYVFSSKVMAKPKVRAPGKRRMVAKSAVSGDYPAVSAILGGTYKGASETLAEFIWKLKKDGKIGDWRDVGILLRSTRENSTNAKPIVTALKERGIKVYNPRNRALNEDKRIKQLLGALAVTLDKNQATFKTIRGRVSGEVKEWMDEYEALAKSKEGTKLAEYVRKSYEGIDKLEKGVLLNITVMDVLYRILSLPPFRDLKEDPNYATKFALITALVDSYTAFTERYGLLRSSATGAGRLSFTFLRDFYYRFSGYIEMNGLNEPEDPENLMPPGHVQVMTVHQAKGLEFPVVVVGSLNKDAKVGGDNWTEELLAPWCKRKPVGTAQERADQDLIRRFYVAYSRAKNLLILFGKEGTATKLAIGG